MTTEIKIKKASIATDSFMLMFVQCLTIFVSIIQAMVLSRALSKEEYGTYGQAMLVINFIAPFLLLGLANAINYFYNLTSDLQKQKQSVQAIFGYVCLLGVIGGIGILAFQVPITSYYSNPALKGLLIYVAFRPLLQNLIGLYYPLYISNGMTKTMAIRNLIISVCQIAITVPVALISQDIKIIFILLLVLDIAQLVILAVLFKKKRFKVSVFTDNKNLFDKDMTKKIFSYALPLGIATMIGTLTVNMDKLFVGRLLSIEDFAMYANMSKELPFSFIVASLTTVVTPVIIRLVSKNNKKDLENLWGNYFEIGYITTWIFCGGALLCARELLVFLYSEKYEAGLSIFIVYILVVCFRVTYFGLMLTAHGKTKQILLYSVVTVALNFVLNCILFQFMGMLGLAVATLISIMVPAALQLIFGAKVAKIKLSTVIRIKQLMIFMAKIAAAMVITWVLKYLIQDSLNGTAVLVICYATFILLVVLLSYKRLRYLVKALNSVESESKQ